MTVQTLVHFAAAKSWLNKSYLLAIATYYMYKYGRAQVLPSPEHERNSLEGSQ